MSVADAKRLVKTVKKMYDKKYPLQEILDVVESTKEEVEKTFMTVGEPMPADWN